jgi:23S rRNA (pseudouridine1915-N3)-methyltransferase
LVPGEGMRLRLIAIGRMRSGPEKDLVARYLDRARAAGRSLGFSDVALRELDESAARRPDDRKAEEAKVVFAQAGPAADLVVFDEAGDLLSSRAFAAALAGRRDFGVSAVSLVLGGPDGLAEGVHGSASLVVSLGRLTYPHQLARILVAEQIYRAMTILSGHPYHRD